MRTGGTALEFMGRGFSAALLATVLLVSGCSRSGGESSESGGGESADIMRSSGRGPVIVSYAPAPLRGREPPDGLGRAVRGIARRLDCSAASFHWSERALSERWLSEQMAARRANGERPRLVLAGCGLGATEAAETAARILEREPDAVIDLLATVDAVKTGVIGSAAGVTGTVLTGKRINFTSYGSAPVPDGVRFLRHVNYFQADAGLYHGDPMPGAENHRVTSTDGTVNHDDIDDYAYPFLLADLAAAAGMRRAP